MQYKRELLTGKRLVHSSNFQFSHFSELILSVTQSGDFFLITTLSDTTMDNSFSSTEWPLRPYRVPHPPLTILLCKKTIPQVQSHHHYHRILKLISGKKGKSKKKFANDKLKKTGNDDATVVSAQANSSKEKCLSNKQKQKILFQVVE